MSRFNSKEAAIVTLMLDELVPTHTTISDVELWLTHEISVLSKTSKQKIGSEHRIDQYLSIDQFEQLLVRVSEWIGGTEGGSYYVGNWKASWYLSDLTTINRQIFRCLTAYNAGVQSRSIKQNISLIG